MFLIMPYSKIDQVVQSAEKNIQPELKTEKKIFKMLIPCDWSL